VARGGGPGGEVCRAATRVLGLGNEILGDDAFGIRVAERIRDGAAASEVEVAVSSESGLRLLDAISGCARLVVVEARETGRAAPGTVYFARDGGRGVFDALALARTLGLDVPREVYVVTVEAAGRHTIGGAMHPAVEAAIPEAVDLIREIYG
jgi:hydrogenase maturation protease